MKQITAYIFEKIKDLPNSVKGLIVFDIDDTILKVDPSQISIYKKEPGKNEVALSTDEFAKDPDAGDPDKKSWYDYRDFRDPVKVYNSIISGTPLIKNLKIMDDYIQAGYDFCFLTARSCEDTVKKAITDFLKFRDGVDFLATTAGSVLSCNILTPIIRNEIATYKQKSHMTKYSQFIDSEKPAFSGRTYLPKPNMQTFQSQSVGLKI